MEWEVASNLRRARAALREVGGVCGTTSPISFDPIPFSTIQIKPVPPQSKFRWPPCEREDTQGASCTISMHATHRPPHPACRPLCLSPTSFPGLAWQSRVAVGPAFRWLLCYYCKEEIGRVHYTYYSRGAQTGQRNPHGPPVSLCQTSNKLDSQANLGSRRVMLCAPWWRRAGVHALCACVTHARRIED
eukprot:scaffold2807_cov336-Prasinococcus_capsulatus_cf.AAC.2